MPRPADPVSRPPSPSARPVRTMPCRRAEPRLQPLTVMTWNVRYFAHGLRGLRTTARGMDRAAQALASLVPLPDVVALQEVETTSVRAGLHPVPQLDRFLTRLHDHLAAAGRPERFTGLYFPAHAYALRGSLPAAYTTGLAILVGPRLVVEAHNAMDPHDITHLRLPWMKPVKQRRIVAHARVRPREGGPSLDVFNTHMSLPAFLEVGPTQVPRAMGEGSNQLREIDRVLDFVHAQTEDAAVLVGDFNTAPGSAAYQHVIDRGLHDAYRHANDLPVDELHGTPTAGFANARMHIDHVFATDNVAWDSVDAFRYGDPAHAFHGLSDHTPKIGCLKLPNDV